MFANKSNVQGVQGFFIWYYQFLIFYRSYKIIPGTKQNTYSRAFIFKVKNWDLEILKHSLNELVNSFDSFNTHFYFKNNIIEKQNYSQSTIAQLDFNFFSFSELWKAFKSDFHILSHEKQTFAHEDFIRYVVKRSGYNNIIKNKLYKFVYIQKYMNTDCDILLFIADHLIYDMFSIEVFRKKLMSTYKKILKKCNNSLLKHYSNLCPIASSSMSKYIDEIVKYKLDNPYTCVCKKLLLAQKKYLKTLKKRGFYASIQDNRRDHYNYDIVVQKNMFKFYKYIKKHNTTVSNVLLSALSFALKNATGLTTNYIVWKHFGRITPFKNINLLNSFGLFAFDFPVKLKYETSRNMYDNFYLNEELYSYAKKNMFGFASYMTRKWNKKFSISDAQALSIFEINNLVGMDHAYQINEFDNKQANFFTYSKDEQIWNYKEDTSMDPPICSYYRFKIVNGSLNMYGHSCLPHEIHHNIFYDIKKYIIRLIYEQD